MKRTHNNGELRISDVNKEVVLIGWVAKKRNLGKMVFIDLRDRYGVTQILCNEQFDEITSKIKNEYIIQVYGVVNKRLNENESMPTGQIEVIAAKVEIINTADTPPLLIQDETDALEDTRLKYRYLDLRRPVMQQKIVTRHKITQSVREYLNQHDFIEVETPVLTKATPEGARDYLVPSRVNPGKFYALPQSPQLFKQLLMISGLEKYYQIARCFRDEDLRSDRQPDFTQIDIEMSFYDEEEILTFLEGMYVKLLKDIKNYDLQVPLRRLSFKDAMNTYGSDKPDTRLGFELKDLNVVFEATEFKILKDIVSENGTIKGINVTNKADVISRKDIDEFTALAKKYRAKGLFWAKMHDNQLDGPLAKNLTEGEKQSLIKAMSVKDNDLLLVLGDIKWEVACQSLGAIRNELGKRYNQPQKDTYDLLWIIDFPLFELDLDTNTLNSTHHPFTRPFKEDIPLLYTDPTKVRAHHYDLVMNGYELGSGSLRIYEKEIQQKVFELIGLSEQEIEDKFGFFTNAFKYGTPPHGGVAFGLDRIAMILTNSDSIRDVIAFPKNQSAVCPLSDAPTAVSDKQLSDLSIKLDIKSK